MNTQEAYREIITNIFPEGNVPRTMLSIQNNTLVAHNNETHNPNDKVFFFERYNGVTNFSEHTYEQPSDELISIARAFKAILNTHFGVGSEVNTSVTQSSVAAYFIERQVNRTATQWDNGDAQLLKEGFQMITEWTKDGTTWTFPWDILN